MIGDAATVLIGQGIEIAGALVVWAVLSSSVGHQDRRYLRFWVWSWLAFAVYTATAVAARLMSPGFPVESVPRIAVSVVSLTAGFLQLIWLLLGTWEFANRRTLTSTWLWPSLGLAAAAALGLTVVGLGDPGAGTLRYAARVGVIALASCATFLAAAGWLAHRVFQERSVAGILLPATLLLYGLNQLLVAYWALPLGLDLPLAEANLRATLEAVDVFVLLLIGVGMLLWMLEVERRELESGSRMLAESEEQYRALAEGATDAIITVDENARIIFANKGAERIFGYAAGDLLGRLMTDLQPPHLRQDYLSALLRYVRTGQLDVPREGFAAFGLHQSGRIIPLEMSLTDILIGGTRHLTGIIRDVSERQRLEERLGQSQRMEAVGRLAGGVAHDFNNLLTAISGYAELSLNDEELGRDGAIRANLMEINGAADRAASLTAKLLALSRRQVVEPQRTDVNRSVSELIPVLSRVIGGNITTSFRLADEPLFIDADPGLIDQALLNLAINARDAMPSGGQLIVSVASSVLESPASEHQPARQGRFCHLQVRDSGVGVPPEHLSTIFEPFFTTKDVGRGTGLGLTTTYGLVQQHGGWIDVRSEPGQGTTLDVFLPCATSGASTRSAVTETAAVSGGPETVLLAEDEASVRRLIRTSLERVGYSVLEAASGPDALASWQRHQEGISLLVTDIVMPGGMTGLDLMARLRRDQPRLPVLLLSGFHDHEIGHDLEGAEYLSKPFALDDLMTSVRQLIDQRLPDGAYPVL